MGILRRWVSSSFAPLFAAVAIGGCAEGIQSASNPPVGTDLPCSVAQVLRSRCGRCHGETPTRGASVPLSTREELLTASSSDPTRPWVLRAVERMRNDANPMPPDGPRATEAEIRALEAWANGGFEEGVCAPDAGPPTQDANAPAATGLPCDVASVLRSRCLSCHGTRPSGGASFSLVTRDDLLAESGSFPGQNQLQRSIVRMTNTRAPMPPTGVPPMAEVDTLQAWLDNGAPAGTCGNTDASVPGSDATAQPDANTTGTGFPCNIQSIVQSRCASCHSNPPRNGAGFPLLSPADFAAESPTHPGVTIAQRSLIRMADTRSPMPPDGVVPGSELSAFTTWVNAGTPTGTCGGVDAGPPPDVIQPDANTMGTGFPCNVQTIVQNRCASCHSNPPRSGAGFPLLSPADFRAASPGFPGQTIGQRSVTRMADTRSPMPPTGVVPTTEMSTFSAWVTAGMPTGTCGGVDAGPPPDVIQPDASTTVGGLPCDVSTMVQSLCSSCHSNPPRNGATEPLLTLANFTATSTMFPGQTMAQRSLARMMDTARPMPPTGGVAAAQLTAFQNWVNMGTPAGTCMMPPDPFSLPPQCSSGSTWTRGNRGSSAMNPGQACMACHRSMGEGPTYTLSGTIYPTGHEPNNCNGMPSTVTLSAVTIEIKNSAGTVIANLHPNSAGNFYSTARFTGTYTARVLYMGRERRMSAPQTNGDCNVCHTQNGTMGAPGRIVLP